MKTRKFKIRYHLAKGDHFMHWQITDVETGDVSYHPLDCDLLLNDCYLHNSRVIARKIFDGLNKTVCAWIECSSYSIFPERSINLFTEGQLFFNPRKQPNWTDHNGKDCDRSTYKDILINPLGIYYF